MASIAKLSVQMAWQGAEVTKGAADASKGLKTVGDTADKSKKSLESIAKVKPINISEMLGLKSLNDVKGLLDMTRGIFQFFIGMPLQAAATILKMGGALETMTIRARMMAGTVEGGNRIIKDLRDLSSDAGVPLEDLAKAFEQFTAAGISTAGAATILAQTGNAIEILGGGAAGANAVAGAITEMRGAAIATEGPLRNLQRGGLRVFEALAKELELVTGNAYSVEDALAAIKDGAVSSATAVRAIFRASSSPEAQAAADAFGASFEGQLRKLSTGFSDLLTEIGKQMLAIIQPEKAFAALRGAFQGVKEVVQEIAAAFLPVIDPGAKGEGLKAIFESSKQIAKDVANKLIDAVVHIKAMFDAVVAGMRKLMQDYRDLTPGRVVSKVAAAPFVAALDAITGVDRGATAWMDAAPDPADVARKARENAAILAAAQAAWGQAAVVEESKVEAAKVEAAANADVAAAAKAAAEAQKKQADVAKQAALELELATKDNSKLTADILKNNMTITEKFAEMTGNLETMVAQAAKGTKESADKLRAAQVRVTGKHLQDLIKQFAPAQAGTAQAFVAGSAGAAEAQIRARVEGMSAQTDPQQAMVAALAEAARQDAVQTKLQERLVAAAERANIIKPGTLVIPK